MAHERWIVVGTDFSDGARVALVNALRLAADAGANVALVHAYEDGAGAPVVDPTPCLLTRLAEEIAAVGEAGRRARVEPIVRRGAPWDKILNVATEYGAELVVVGANGERGALPGLSLGSVASRVLALSFRSVLVARCARGGPRSAAT